MFAQTSQYHRQVSKGFTAVKHVKNKTRRKKTNLEITEAEGWCDNDEENIQLDLRLVTFHWNSQYEVQRDVDASEGGNHYAEKPA